MDGDSSEPDLGGATPGPDPMLVADGNISVLWLTRATPGDEVGETTGLFSVPNEQRCSPGITAWEGGENEVEGGTAESVPTSGDMGRLSLVGLSMVNFF